jgi:formyl-CoA transferase
VDASLYETGLAWLKGHFASYRIGGVVPECDRTGSPRIVPFQSFETRTGPLLVGAGNDRLFAKLAGALGHPEWATDPRYATNRARLERKAELLALIEPLFRAKTKGEWIDLLEAAGVPCAAIHTLPEAVTHPQAAALGMIQAMPGADFELVALPLSFDGARPAIRRAPPGIGEHNGEIVTKTAPRR